MQGKKEDIEIDEAITYSLVSDTFSRSLKLHNKSPHIYVFKVKTNQRSVISMQLTHDFIKPGTTKEIVIKLAEKPSETTPLRLEFNYAIPTEEEIRINDSKMNSYGKDAVFRKIITITRDDSVNPTTGVVGGSGEKSNGGSADRSKEGMGMATETVNISNMSFSEEKTEEVKPVFSEKKEEIKVEIKVEPKVQPKPAPKVEPRFEPKVEPKIEPKPEPKPVEQKSSIFPSLSSYLPRQVESEQITVQPSKSTEINTAQLIQQPPKPINKPVNLGNLAQQALKIQQPVLSESNNADNFSYASSSPTNKQRTVLQKRASSSQQSLQELTQKLQRQKSTILRLKAEQSTSMRSDCVYPVPVIYLLVLGAFLSGSLMNWLIL